MTTASSTLATPAVETLNEPTTLESPILEELLAAPRRQPPPALAGPLVGECVNDRHPVLLGRYLVRYPIPEGGEAEKWLAGLHGSAIRTGDRVLLVQPGNWPEPIISGVVDGFAHRPEVPTSDAAKFSLKPDEIVRVESERGIGLVEVRQGATGPVMRFLNEDVQLELPGKLGITAKSIDLRSTLGGVDITATDDVTIRGEVVKLN